jgi:N-acetylmuramoyl-L-alanine amidase
MTLRVHIDWRRSQRAAFGRVLRRAAAIVLMLGVTLFAGGAGQVTGGNALAATPQPAPSVINARVGLHESMTRLVLTLTEPVAYGVFVLANPHQVVIDLPEVNWSIAEAAMPGRRGFLERVRFGPLAPGHSRVVAELSAPVHLREVFMLPPRDGHPYRLVIDMSAAIVKRSTPASAGPIGVALPLAHGAAWAAPALPRPLERPTPRVVVLDPGHGGKDPGAISPSGVREKDITLRTAREVADLLRATSPHPYKVILTRNSDTFIRLRHRVAIARRAKADLFVSIHADAQANPLVRGASIYTLSERASDREAAALAERENKVDLIAGINLSAEPPDVANILINLAQRETMNRSVRLASVLSTELQRETLLLPRSHRFAGFAVLKAADVPSVLIEMGFLSNRTDEQLLARADHRKRLAHAIVRAIHAYFQDVELASLP